jgi:hypothetical protein
LKALATFLVSFNFTLFTSKMGTCSTECTFPLSFFIMFHVATVVLLLSFFYNFLRMLHITCFPFGSLLFLVKVYRLILYLQDIFIPRVIQSFFSLVNLYLTGKLAWKMFKIVHRNELNIWLSSLSL